MIDQIKAYINAEAKKFGANNSNEYLKSYIERNNTSNESLADNGGYFGFIHPDEEHSGPFHDFSLTIFPTLDNKPWVVCLGVGSLGFKNDYELAAIPGVRRIFSSIISANGFCKTSFTDIESSLPKSFFLKAPHLKNTLKTYAKVLPVCEIVDPTSDLALKKISAFVAGYAKLREWATNKEHKKAVIEALAFFKSDVQVNFEEEALQLLLERKFIILEGPPGTGKTRLAKVLSTRIGAVHYLTQFHSEVSYSDFITGIRPDISSSALSYISHSGIFKQALDEAKQKKVVLIIDEINRANLASVLGPLFYLLEYNRNEDNFSFRLPDGQPFEELPREFYIIGTMNTADRSLAVVDFAMRRRFGWLTLKPHSINDSNFYPDDFEFFSDIFNWYADSSELNFQPGQAYFFANSKDEMKRRINYELFPLIKEYLSEGIMIKAKEEFNSYFIERIGKTLFE